MIETCIHALKEAHKFFRYWLKQRKCAKLHSHRGMKNGMWSLLSQTPNKEWTKGEKTKSKGMCSFCHAEVGVKSTLYKEGFAAQVTQSFACRTLD